MPAGGAAVDADRPAVAEQHGGRVEVDRRADVVGEERHELADGEVFALEDEVLLGALGRAQPRVARGCAWS